MKVVTFGEIMLRLSPPGYQRFSQAAQFDVHYGGSESNVALSLACFGVDSVYVSKLPSNPLGQAAINSLRQFGVDTSEVVRGGDRIGLYYLETGASQRSSKVVYDRSHSAITTLALGEIDWDAIMSDADWFHWSGITPALGEKPRQALQKALETARSNGVIVSCDLNYRAKLWTSQQAQQHMRLLVEYIDVCIGNGWHAEQMLGFTPEDIAPDRSARDSITDADVAKALKAAYDFDVVAITARESISASRNVWSAMLLGDTNATRPATEPCYSRRYDIDVVDRVGGGDSFVAGLIYGLLTRDDPADALDFAVAASCLKLTIPGDANLSTTDEVESLMAQQRGAVHVER